MSNDPKEQTLLSWKAPEFHHYKKGQWWFPALALVTLVLTTYFVLTQQYLVAIIIILGGITVYRLAHQEPDVLPVIFSPQGIKFRDKLYLFSNLKTFWILEHDEHNRLYIQPVERFSTVVAIPIVKEDIEKVRDFLRYHLPESHDATEDLADRLNRWLKI